MPIVKVVKMNVINNASTKKVSKYLIAKIKKQNVWRTHAKMIIYALIVNVKQMIKNVQIIALILVKYAIKMNANLNKDQNAVIAAQNNI